MRGALFENWVIIEFLKRRWNAGRESNLFFWRSHGGLEVDLVLEQGQVLAPVEIKSGATVSPDWLRPLRRWHELAGDAAGRPVIVYGVDQSRSSALMKRAITRSLMCRGFDSCILDAIDIARSAVIAPDATKSATSLSPKRILTPWSSHSRRSALSFVTQVQDSSSHTTKQRRSLNETLASTAPALSRRLVVTSTTEIDSRAQSALETSCTSSNTGDRTATGPTCCPMSVSTSRSESR